MTDAMVRMEKTFKGPLADIGQQLQKEKIQPNAENLVNSIVSPEATLVVNERPGD
jgi:hypothetical protein